MTTVLLVVAGLFGLIMATAAVLALGLVVRAARAHTAGREKSDLAGAPERLARRDLPELDTRRISREDLP